MRRKIGHIRLGAVAAVAATSLLAAACGSSGGSAGSGSGSGNNASLTVAWYQPPDTINPATTGARSVGPIDANIFDTLVWLTPSLKVTPDLATSWTLSPDGKTYTFTLRKGVKFQDGTPFNAQSVVANINYITAKTTQSTISLGLLGPCTTATATAQYTVQITCSQPYAPLLAQLGEPYLGIQSPTAIKTYGKNLGEHPVGTGPFKFVSYVPNQSLVLERNPAYDWAPPAIGHNGPSKIAKLTFDFVTSDQSRIGALQSGQAQLIDNAPGAYYKSLKSSYTEMSVPISGMGYFAPINAGSFPTNDLAVRQAIEYATNKTALIQLADEGVYTPSNSPLIDMPGYEAAFGNMYPYDPAKAEQVLAAGGWKKVAGIWTKNGQKLSLTISDISNDASDAQLAQAMQSQLSAVGMQVKIDQLAIPAWIEANLKGTISLTPLQYVAVDPDALHLWFLPGQYYNWSHYTNPTLTSLIKRGEVTDGTTAREQIYQQAEHIIMQQAAMLPLYQNADLLMYSKNLSGVAYSGGGFEYFYAASLH